ncbi:MAG: Glucose-responsive transcription factor [Vezdaea aestivalis]|nr:MAG: Glucose-responsive transcription factor [Vezdaea aestivalis]
MASPPSNNNKPSMLAPSHYSLTVSSTTHPTSPMQSPKSLPASLVADSTSASATASLPGPAQQSHSHSYPDPTPANQHVSAPFFPPQDSFQLAAIAQHNVAATVPPLPGLSNEGVSVDLGGRGDSESPISQLGGTPGTAPRKRSKASRACDECRRKKIKCDATSETVGSEPCSSCRRLDVTCQFSRAPMKRGPSKGYIQNLADRVVELENSSRLPNGLSAYEGAISPGGSTDFSPASSTPGSVSKQARKRTFSASNDPPNYTYFPPTSQRASVGSSWSPQETMSRHLPHPGSAQKLHTPHSSVSERSHRSSNPQTSSFSSTDILPPSAWGHRHSSTLPEVNWQRLASQDTVELDGKMLDSYNSIIRPIFPLLPDSKDRLEAILAPLHHSLRQAFLHALYAAVNSCLPLATPSDTPHSTRASLLINSYQCEVSGQSSRMAILIHLQTLLFLSMETGSHGPPNSKGRVGPTPAVWLGNAFGLSHALRLHDSRANPVLDSDDEDNLARRTFLCLVNLDRWHAAGMACPPFSLEGDVAVYPEDEPLLGAAVYQFTRLSSDLSTLTTLLRSSLPTPPLASMFTTSLLNRLSESVSTLTPPSPFLSLAHQHLLLLATRYKPAIEPQALLIVASSMFARLRDDALPLSPLHHHFIALVGWTLAEVYDAQVGGPGDAEAKKACLDLRDALDRRITSASEASPVAAAAVNAGWDRAIRDILPSGDVTPSANPAAPPGGLEQLAQLAVRQNVSTSTGSSTTPSAPAGSSSDSTATAVTVAAAPLPASNKWDPTRVTRQGYLNAFAGD